MRECKHKKLTCLAYYRELNYKFFVMHTMKVSTQRIR
jgi:hypothetical protein